jgi:hypothetical protein
MKTENENLRDNLRALMWFPAMALPEYSTDPVVQRRVGEMLARLSTPSGPPAIA